jgi:hypothetical protein
VWGEVLCGTDGRAVRRTTRASAAHSSVGEQWRRQVAGLARARNEKGKEVNWADALRES